MVAFVGPFASVKSDVSGKGTLVPEPFATALTFVRRFVGMNPSVLFEMSVLSECLLTNTAFVGSLAGVRSEMSLQSEPSGIEFSTYFARDGVVRLVGARSMRRKVSPLPKPLPTSAAFVRHYTRMDSLVDGETLSASIELFACRTLVGHLRQLRA